MNSIALQSCTYLTVSCSYYRHFALCLLKYKATQNIKSTEHSFEYPIFRHTLVQDLSLWDATLANEVDKLAHKRNEAQNLPDTYDSMLYDLANFTIKYKGAEDEKESDDEDESGSGSGDEQSNVKESAEEESDADAEGEDETGSDTE